LSADSLKEKGAVKHFGALLLGAHRHGKLRYFGHSGRILGRVSPVVQKSLAKLPELFLTPHQRLTDHYVFIGAGDMPQETL
jgi:hypothetical protein